MGDASVERFVTLQKELLALYRVRAVSRFVQLQSPSIRMHVLAAQKKQYRQMFHIAPTTVPDLYFETRLASIALPSAQGTWSTLLRRVGGLSGLRTEADLGANLSHIQAPALVLWGDGDFAPAEVGRAATGSIPMGDLSICRARAFPVSGAIRTRVAARQRIVNSVAGARREAFHA